MIPALYKGIWKELKAVIRLNKFQRFDQRLHHHPQLEQLERHFDLPGKCFPE